MLGALRGSPARSWQWAAAGKHPAARDYIRLGACSPMMDGFADWVAGGYRALEYTDRKALPPPCSFRFWARGAGAGSLACGVLRDSSDAVGRPFPLLIIGSGALDGWEDRWDALPLACESAWLQMETMANRLTRELKPLEEELARIRPPQPDWDRYAGTGRAMLAPGGAKGAERTRILGEIEARAPGVARDTSGVVSIDGSPDGDVFPAIQAWHTQLKAYAKEPLSALFVGGNAQRTWMAYFRRPLEAGDFPRIWGRPGEAA